METKIKHSKDCGSHPDSKHYHQPCSCYASRSKEQWIAWAKKEIAEYEKFIKFLEGKEDK